MDPNFNIKPVNLSHMYDGCTRIVAERAVIPNFERAIDTSYMFANCDYYNLKYFILNNLDDGSKTLSNLTDMSYIFYKTGGTIFSSGTIRIVLNNCPKLTNISGMFRDLYHYPLSTSRDNIHATINSELNDNHNIRVMSNPEPPDLGGSDSPSDLVTQKDISIVYDKNNITNASHLFNECMNNIQYPSRTKLKIDLTNFNTSCIQNMSYMFANHNKVMLEIVGTIDMKSCTNWEKMFYNCGMLQSKVQIKNPPEGFDGAGLRPDQYELILPYNYDGKYGPIPDPDTGLVDLTDYSLKYIKDYQTITEIPKENLDYLNSGLNVNNMTKAFSHIPNVTKLDISNINTSQCISFRYTFGNFLDPKSAMSFTEIKGLSLIDTKNATDMSGMFSGCCKLKSFDISNFDTSNTVNMSSMFEFSDISNLKFDRFNTAKVTDMSNMFSLSTIRQDFINILDTSNVTNMKGMFFLL